MNRLTYTTVTRVIRQNRWDAEAFRRAVKKAGVEPTPDVMSIFWDYPLSSDVRPDSPTRASEHAWRNSARRITFLLMQNDYLKRRRYAIPSPARAVAAGIATDIPDMTDPDGSGVVSLIITDKGRAALAGYQPLPDESDTQPVIVPVVLPDEIDPADEESPEQKAERIRRLTTPPTPFPRPAKAPLTECAPAWYAPPPARLVDDPGYWQDWGC